MRNEEVRSFQPPRVYRRYRTISRRGRRAGRPTSYGHLPHRDGRAPAAAAQRGASSPSRVEDAQFPGVDVCDALPNGVVAGDAMAGAAARAFRSPIDRARCGRCGPARHASGYSSLSWHTLCDKHGAGGGAASARSS